jgi:putative membrane-bound dehydrogenase-like protein
MSSRGSLRPAAPGSALPRLTLLAAIVLLLIPAPARLHARQTGPLLDTGLARVDISPTNAVRLMGYAARADSPAPTNVLQRLHARALAIGSGTQAVVVVTIDNCILPGALTTEIRQRVAARTGLATNRIALAVTHTHSAPCLTGAAPNIFARDISAEDHAQIDTYTRFFVGRVEEVILAALADRRPARLSWGEGRVGFAKNRRTPGGPVDHALPVLRVSEPNGSVRGLLANYACHCTTLSGGINASHGDWAGVAALDLESGLPGATALIAIGCGADSNPEPRGSIELVEQHGRSLAAEARRLLELPLAQLTEAPRATQEIIALPFQPHFTRDQWEKRAQTPGIVGHHARRWLARLDRNEPPAPTLPYPVQTFTFGTNLAMVFLGGEVVVDYALRLKTELDPARLWVNGYANDVPGYIPSRRILREGGYEAESSLWYYDRPQQFDPALEDQIIGTVRSLLGPAFLPAPKAGEMTPPKEARRALESFSLPPDLAIDLVASDDLVQSPVAIDFGDDGRLWVCEMADYPAGLNGGFEPGGRLKVLTDTDRDGRFDQATVVASGLPFPTGLMVWGDQVLVCAAPDILRISADGSRREVLFTGFATHNFQARVNGLRWGLDHWIHGSGGLFGGRIRHPASGREIAATGRDFRFRLPGGEFEALPGVSQQGRVRDDFGNWFGNDNGSLLWSYPLPPEAAARGIEPPQARIPSNRDDNRVFPTSVTLERFNDPHTANHLTSACAPEIYRDSRLGPEYSGNAFVCEPVHNLIRRATLTPAGLGFAARRATNESRSDFLTSSDNWFRPVEVRTGPDGALWVVDMYRFVIEHSRWIPSERLKNLDPRAGADRGRIYRIRQRTEGLRPLPQIASLPPEALAATIASPNGVLRDMAHRRIHREAPTLDDAARADLVARLRQTFANAVAPEVLVQTFAVLQGLGADRTVDLEQLLDSSDTSVVRFALGRVPSTQTFVALFTKRLHPLSTDAALRFPLACALERQGTNGLAQLVFLLLNHPTDPWLTAVVDRAAAAHPDVFAVQLAGSPESYQRNETALAPFLDRLAPHLTPSAASMLILFAPATSRGSALAWIARIQNQPTLEAGLQPTARTRLKSWESELAPLAPAIAAGSTNNLAERSAALLILAQQAPSNPTARSALVQLLDTDLPVTLRQPLTTHLSRLASPELAVDLLAHWATLPPSRRAERITLLLARPASTRVLLAAIRKQRVTAAELSAAQRDQLRRHTDTALASEANALFPVVPSTRAEVLQRFQPALQLTGNPTHGGDTFDRLCASCHALRGHGHAVGPDISVYRTKPPGDFLTAVLDPNAAVDGRAAAYQVTATDGRELSGIVTDESAAAFTLVQPGGLRVRLQRTEVTRLDASPLSLMPEGLEGSLQPQDLADLLAWIRRTPGVFGAADPATQQASLAQWRAAASPRAEVLRGSNPPLPYPSWIGRFPLHVCRQNIGQDRLSWETRTTPGTGRVTLRWPAAMGLHSQRGSHFTLQIASQPLLDFDVTLDDAEWASADRGVVLRYRVEERNDEDSNGILELDLDRARVPTDGRVRISIQASNNSSQRWFGLYELP